MKALKLVDYIEEHASSDAQVKISKGKYQGTVTVTKIYIRKDGTVVLS